MYIYIHTHIHTHTHIYIYITGSLCCIAQINTILEINYISIKRKKNFLLFWKCPGWLEDSWQVGNSVLRLQAACPYEAPQTVSPHPPGSGPGREVGLTLSPCPGLLWPESLFLTHDRDKAVKISFPFLAFSSLAFLKLSPPPLQSCVAGLSYFCLRCTKLETFGRTDKNETLGGKRS